MKFSVLSSGSRANSTYLTDGETHILIDAGLSFKQLSHRLMLLGIDPGVINGVIITHEHTDHIAGLSPLMNKVKDVAIFCNEGTAQSERLSKYDLSVYTTSRVFTAGTFAVESVPTYHDGIESCGLVLTSGNTKLGVFTDLGGLDDTHIFSELDALILESNHDKVLLELSDYHDDLKMRIASQYGHLGNDEAKVLLENCTDKCKVVLAAHISENSNTPELALYELRKALPATTKLLAASPYFPTDLIELPYRQVEVVNAS